ncbi:RNA methyltransferase [Candidatus Dependentiae bacterium]|nr:MAG: RNA methyltransferase [Candidatus Dependentiae bacterium]
MQKNHVYISSVHNQLIKHVALLKNAPKYRKEQKLFLAEGLRVVETVLQNRLPLVHFFTTELQLEKALALTNQHQKIIVCSDAVIKKISSSTTPAGFIGVFAQPAPSLADFKYPGIVLAQIADPGNMGTLIRSAAAFNAKTVVVVEGVDPWSCKVVQASAGAISMVQIFQLPWQQLVEMCKQKNIQLNALVIDGTQPLQNASSTNQLLVVGNEARGLCNEWQKDCALKTTIAMPGNTESLNVAVAGSIALYSILKI